MARGPAFFVDPTKGSNDNDGTKEKAWKTIAHALQQISAGDTLYLRGGTYYEHVYCSATGTAVISSQAQTVCFAHVRSTDLDGDGVVTALDETAHQALAVDALAGDYDCNGVADAADLALLQSQLNENCLTVQNLPGTWGWLKAIYR